MPETLKVEQLTTNVINAINLTTTNAVIDSAKIANLDASKITSGSIDADILTANIIDAINLSVSVAKIDSKNDRQQPLGYLDYSHSFQCAPSAIFWISAPYVARSAVWLPARMDRNALVADHCPFYQQCRWSNHFLCNR